MKPVILNPPKSLRLTDPVILTNILESVLHVGIEDGNSPSDKMAAPFAEAAFRWLKNGHPYDLALAISRLRERGNGCPLIDIMIYGDNAGPRIPRISLARLVTIINATVMLPETYRSNEHITRSVSELFVLASDRDQTFSVAKAMEPELLKCAVVGLYQLDPEFITSIIYSVSDHLT